MNFDSVWLDMDGTLMDWSKGNVRRALIDISSPFYYYTLRPSGKNILKYLQILKRKGASLHVISAIPENEFCEYVPLYKYDEYYKVVCDAKDYTIRKYFGNIFDTVDYTLQSESKAKYIKEKYNPSRPLFIDDMDKYISEWKKDINDNAYLVDEFYTCEDYLQMLAYLGFVRR